MFVRTLRGGLLLLLLAAPAAAQVLDIVDLRTEGLARPLALDTDTPRFSFRLVDAEPLRPARNIRIATARVDLFRVVDGAPSATPFWSTSVTGVEPEVGRGADLVYTGPALPSFATLAWRVSVDVLRGTETIRSRWAEFETGPRRPEDWAGRWIGAAEAIDPGVRLPAAGAAWIWAPASDLGPPAKHKLIHVRSRFRVPKADAATAVLLVAVDNVARIFVDGKPLGEHRDWRKWRTIELGAALGPGDDHCLAIEAENSDGPAGLLAIVNFGEGGAVDALASAKTALEVPAAWVSPDFDDGAWKSAATVGAESPPRLRSRSGDVAVGATLRHRARLLRPDDRRAAARSRDHGDRARQSSGPGAARLGAGVDRL